MKVLVTNTVVLNSGEAATVRALVGLLRRTFGPETEVIVYEQRPEAAARYYPDLRFRRLLFDRASHAPPIRRVREWVGRILRGRFQLAARLLRDGREGLARLLLTREEARDLEEYRTADLVVSSGGTYLVANYDIRPRLFDFEISLLFDRPLVLFTQSMGPFRPETRERLRTLLDRAALVLLRDDASVRHLRGLGVTNPEVHGSADAVFALEPGPRRVEVPLRPPDGEVRLRVAVSVRHWYYFRTCSEPEGMTRYRAAIAAAVSRLVRAHGARVTFLSTCQGIPEYWFDDASVAREIVAALPEDVRRAVQVDGGFRTPERLREELAAFDFVIATRFHMAILAMLAGVPPLALAYEFKTDELYRRLDLSGWVHDMEEMDERAFCDRLDRCLEDLPRAREALARGVAAERERALKAGERLRRVLEASGRSCAGSPREPVPLP